MSSGCADAEVVVFDPDQVLPVYHIVTSCDDDLDGEDSEERIVDHVAIVDDDEGEDHVDYVDHVNYLAEEKARTTRVKVRTRIRILCQI